MGLFDKKEMCSICNNELGKSKYNDGWVCKSCINKCGIFIIPKHCSCKEVEKAIKRNIVNGERKNIFKATKKVGNYIHIDETNKLVAFPSAFGKIDKVAIYNYSEILGCDVLEDGQSISKGGLGRAVAGGLLFGGVGAIVGGVTGSKKTKQIINSMKVKITVNDISNPTQYISLIESETKSTSFMYSTAKNNAEQIVSLINIIINDNNTNLQQDTMKSIEDISVAEEIRKFKQLADDGIITEEEFENKKKELLNL